MKKSKPPLVMEAQNSPEIVVVKKEEPYTESYREIYMAANQPWEGGCGDCCCCCDMPGLWGLP